MILRVTKKLEEFSRFLSAADDANLIATMIAISYTFSAQLHTR